MFKHSLTATAAALALFGAATVSTAGEDQAHDSAMHKMEHCDDAMPQGVKTAKTQADHKAIAKRYEAEAAKFDHAAARHAELAKHYEHGHGAAPKGNPAAMAQHCNNLVKNLKASADDAREMARLHRELGQALVK